MIKYDFPPLNSSFFDLPERRLDLVVELELTQTQMTQKPMLRAEDRV